MIWFLQTPLLPSGKRLHNYGKSPFLMGKSTISMAIFNSYVSLPEGNQPTTCALHESPSISPPDRLENPSLPPQVLHKSQMRRGSVVSLSQFFRSL